MPSTLPSRWQEILRREAAANVGQVLAQAKDQASPHQVPRWTVPVIVVTIGSFSLLGLMSGEAKSGGTLPFDRNTLISTRTAGLGADAEDLAPPKSPSPLPAPAVKASPDPVMGAIDREPKPVPRPRPVKPRLVIPSPVPEPSPELAAQVAPSPAPPKPAPLVINVGTRIEAVLTDPLTTGAALAPVSARVVHDFFVGDRLAIPAGTLLVGEAFATNQNDRVQVVFSAIVKAGKTLTVEGWALQDGEMGMRGKVVRKGSKVKKGAGAVVGAAASALSFGLVGSLAGPEGAALASLGNTAATNLSGLGRDWDRSDKAIHVASGMPLTVYVRRDVTVE